MTTPNSSTPTRQRPIDTTIHASKSCRPSGRAACAARCSLPLSPPPPVMTGAFANSAFSQGFGPPWRAGPPWGQTFDPAAVEDRADRMVRHLAIEVDATAEQQERLRGIVRSAVRDLLPLREKATNSRQRGRELLTQTTIDRAAIETLARRADGARRSGDPPLHPGARRRRQRAEPGAAPEARRADRPLALVPPRLASRLTIGLAPPPLIPAPAGIQNRVAGFWIPAAQPTRVTESAARRLFDQIRPAIEPNPVTMPW